MRQLRVSGSRSPHGGSVVAILIAGCATPPASSLAVQGASHGATTESSANCPARILVETPLSFDDARGAWPAPMVRARIRGVDTKLIVDTGATTHVLTRDLALRAGLTLAPSEPGTDHAGQPVESWEVGKVAAQIGGSDVALHGAVAIRGPAYFDASGIGGIVSPQHLHASALVLLDFVDHRLSVVEVDAMYTAACLRARHPRLRLVSLQRESGQLVMTRAAIDPFAAVPMMFNTGGPQTEVAASIVPGLRGSASTRVGRGASGGSIHGEDVLGQHLRVGTAAVLAVPRLLVRPEMPEPRGMLGMDLIAETVLAFRADPAQPIEWLLP